jgi:hypothetical protein
MKLKNSPDHPRICVKSILSLTHRFSGVDEGTRARKNCFNSFRNFMHLRCPTLVLCWLVTVLVPCVTSAQSPPPIDCGCMSNLPPLHVTCPGIVPDLCALATNCASTNLLAGSCVQNMAPGMPLVVGNYLLQINYMDLQSNSFACAVPFIVDPPVPAPKLTLSCSSNKTVECGTDWSFDPPTVLTACCTVNMLTTDIVLSNGPCSKVLTRSWQVTDGCGNVASCSQTVTVVDTTPPGRQCGINLVPNWSFESYTNWPSASGELDFAAPWFTPSDGSSDYYNSCTGVGSFVSTPTNGMGVQVPLSGQGYAGLVVWSVYGLNTNNNLHDYREYVEVPLRAPLLAGRQYQVSFNVSRADKCHFAIAELGAYLSPLPLVTNGYDRNFPVVPQVENPSANLLASTNAWMLVQGTFTAAGGESYLTIGNFRTDAATTWALVPGGTYPDYAYYYFDDVSVVELCSPNATNKVVQCGSAWSFDPPDAFDLCSGSNVTVSVASTVTNGGCPVVATRSWTLSDPCGNTNTLSQTVTVVDTNPPFVLCAGGANLVPNPDFESCTNCPNYATQIDYASPWFTPTGASPDYFSACAPFPSIVSVPTNFAGVQNPLSGQAYAGAVVYTSDGGNLANSYREYLAVPLATPLLAGQAYLVSFHVSLADFSSYAMAEIGAHFSVGPVTNYAIQTGLPVVPQVQNSPLNLLASKTNWMLVQGNFTASGGENYLTLGNFLSDANTTAVPAGPGTEPAAYYYFDDVSVVPLCAAAPTNKVVSCGSDWTFDTPVGYDLCSGTNVTVSVVGTVTNSLCPLSVTRAWTLADLCGNTNLWQQTVTVINTNPPVLICGCLQDSAIPVLSANACSGVVPNLCLFTNCFSAPCGSVTQSPLAGTVLGPGSHMITVTVQNCAGSSLICEVPFTVDPGPTIACPANITLTTSSNSAVAIFSVTATGNTGPVVCSPPSGSAFPLGTNLVTCTATNSCTNVTCSFTVTVSAVTCTPPPANMVLWLKFDEAAGATAFNACAGNHGALVNGPAHNPGQYVANSLCFDGVSQYVQVAPYPAMQFGTSDFSVDAWVKPATLDNSLRTIVDHREENGSVVRGYTLFLGGNNSIGFQIGDGGFVNYPFAASVVPVDGQWHHVAVTVKRNDPQGIRVYVDGVADPLPRDPTGHPGSVTAGPCYPFRVASRSSSVSALFPGCVDEVELFRRALTPSEVQSLFSARSQGKCRFSCQPGGGLPACWSGGVITNSLVINNYLPTPQAFNWSLAPLPAGPGCSKPGPTFSPASGTLMVPAWSAGVIPTAVTLPTGFTYGDCSCYQMTVSLPGSSQQVTCPGSFCLPGQPWFLCATATTLLGTATNLGASAVSFTLAGTGSTPTPLTKPAAVLRSPENVVVWATPLPDVTVPPRGGGSLEVPAGFAFPEYDPGRLYTLSLEAGTDSTGQSSVLASVPVINVVPATPPADAITAKPGPGGTIIIVWPNPCGILKEATELLGSTTVWSVVTNTPTSSDGSTYQVTLPPEHTQRFYRLETPR